MLKRAIALALLFAFCATGRAQTLFRWKFSPEQTLQVSFDQTTTTETTGAGKPKGINIRMQMGMTWKINSVQEDGTAEITQQFDSLKLSMKSGKADAIEYDSASEKASTGAAATIAAGVQPLLGARFKVSMTNRGVIREVTLPDETSESLKAIDSATIKQLFSAEGITKILRQSAIELPEAAVDAGATWEFESETKTPLGLLKQNHTYKLAGKEESIDKITIDTQLELRESPAKLKLLDQISRGTLLFDSELGRVVRSESIQELTTERPYREFKIKVVTTSTSAMTITTP